MSINLIESDHRTQKSVRSTFVSVAVHACLITLAVYASAGATEVRVDAPSDTVIVFYPPAPMRPTHGSRTNERPVFTGQERVPTLPRSPITLSSDPSTHLPTIDVSPVVIDDGHELFTGGSSDDGPISGTKQECMVDCAGMFYTHTASDVEKAVAPRGGNHAPVYPSLLESSHVEGSVLVEFVVDTLGVADMSTFWTLEATNDLFAASTKAAVSGWRFFPAEAGGRKVRQIVQLPLRFVAPHH